MDYRTDDDIYRARLVYLGPPNYTLPVQLPYAQWVLFVVLAFTFCTIGIAIDKNVLSFSGGIAIAMFATAYIWGHVDPDMPARKLIEMAAVDWRPVRPIQAAALPRLSGRHIRFSYLNDSQGSPR